MTPLLSFACLLSVGQPDGVSEAAKAELRQLQGTWAIEAQNESGKELAGAALRGRTVSFGLSAFLIRHRGVMEQLGKLKIDPVKKTLNATIDRGENEGDLLLGLYERDGDRLTLCLGTDGDSRPKELKPGPERLLLRCKRVPEREGEGDLSGRYRSTTTDVDGQKLESDATIERVGDCYVVVYAVRGKTAFVGTGIRRGDVFALGWVSQRAGVSLYRIEKGNRLVGEFAQVGGPGFLGTETLVPVPAARRETEG